MTERVLKPGWKVWRFDQIATSIGKRVEPGDTDAEYYVGLGHLDSDSLKIRRWGKPSDVEATKLLFRKGDIIFGRRRVYQRKLAVAEFDGICSAHAMVLRPKTDVVLHEFLPFFMQSDLFMQRALEISVGSLSPTINWRTLAKQEFALPPLAEQRRICHMLKLLFTQVKNTRELLSSAKVLDLANLHTLIPFPIRIKGKYSLANQFLESGWRLARVSDISDVIRGASPRPKGDPRYYNGPIPRLMVEDITRDGMYVTPCIDTLTEAGAKLSRYVSSGTIVMVCSGSVGVPSILSVDACIHDGILALINVKDKIPSEYLYYVFLRMHREFIRLTTNGGIWSNLTTSILKSMEIPIPPSNMMTCILDQLRTVTDATSLVLHRLRQTQAMYKQVINYTLGANGRVHESVQ